MAKSIILDKKNGIASSVKSKNHSVSKITDISHSAKVSSIDFSSKASTKDYPVAKITNLKHEAKVSSILPFRIKFTAIGIPGYGPSNPAPIGIAIIGYSNYIL